MIHPVSPSLPSSYVKDILACEQLSIIEIRKMFKFPSRLIKGETFKINFEEKMKKIFCKMQLDDF